MVTNTTFVDYITPVPASWLNNVDQNVNWTPPYTGGQIQEIAFKAGQTISVKDFGASGNNVADDTTAFQAALTYLQSIGGGSLYIPKGIYKLTSQLTFTFANAANSLHIYGDSQESTTLNFTSSNGFNIIYNSPYNSINFEKFTMECGTTNLYNGITITKADSFYDVGPINSFRDLSFRGNTGYNQVSGPFWQTAIVIVSVSNFNFDCCNFTGSCTTFGVASTAQGQAVYMHGTLLLPPVVFNFTGCNFQYLAVGINYGNYTQGVAISNSNFTVCIAGVEAAGGLSNTLSQLSIVNSQFACSTNAVGMGTGINPFIFTGNLVEIYPNSYGIGAGQLGIGSITGNTFLGLSSQVGNIAIGIQGQPAVLYSFPDCVITGNCFYGLALGIQIAAGVSGINIQSNVYPGCIATINDASTGNTHGGGSI